MIKVFLRSVRAVCLALMVILTGTTPAAHGQTKLPPCTARPTWVDPPWVDGAKWCLERVIQDDSGGELGFTALAAAPDGTLYAARPLAGQVLALMDTDGDGLPDTAQIVADDLTLPNGLAYYDDALYISGGSHIYRLRGKKFDTLVDNLPSEGGFWTGGLAVADDRIYVGIGAPCDYCQPDDPQRGAIWSFALDGSDKQVMATGLRQPADVAFRDGILWTVDTARDGADGGNLDELNRVTPGANFGWPFCVGADNHPDTLQGDFECSKAAAPELTFPTHSGPLGIAVYESDTFPDIKGNLLVTMGGSDDQVILQGYTLVSIAFNPETGSPSGSHIIIPEQSLTSQQPVELQKIHYQGSGFWPHRPIDVTVSPEGWIYVSVGGGTIYALRPR